MAAEENLCYICYDTETSENPYALQPRPCACKGSIVIHLSCLEICVKRSTSCGTCKKPFHKIYHDIPKYRASLLGLKQKMEFTSSTKAVYTIDRHEKKHGTYSQYNEEGIKIKDAFYKEDKLHGHLRTYYETGELMSHASYQEGALHGINRRYSPDGKVTYEGAYQQNKLHGRHVYYNDSQPSQELNYEQGILLTKKDYQPAPSKDYIVSTYENGILKNTKTYKHVTHPTTPHKLLQTVITEQHTCGKVTCTYTTYFTV